MFFNSYSFVFLFFPITIAGYYFLNFKKKYQWGEIFLLLMSLIFYGLFELKCVPVILAGVLINYAFACVLRKNPRRLILALGIIFNILLLGYFKYFNFILENFNKLFSTGFTPVQLLVPIGISFMTFQQISYLVDVYRNKEYHYTLKEYALFVMFFPYVISGPITRHNHIIPQFREIDRKAFHPENFSKGIYAFSLGLAKKVLIADTFAVVANTGFNNIAALNTTSALIAMLSYTLQIYFDFSGYSDMVIGIGKMLNFDMPLNFNSPYKATNILDFWKRWHISLTSFLTEYIYYPLGGNRKGMLRTYMNVMVVFLVSGLWHGANWTFIIWGTLHGIASVINRIFKKQIAAMNQTACWILCFLFINVTWVFFRAVSIHDAFAFFKTIGSCQFGQIMPEMLDAFMLPEITMLVELFFVNTETMKSLLLLAALFITVLCILLMKNTTEKLSVFRPTIAKELTCSLLLVWCIISFSGITSFIYVNF